MGKSSRVPLDQPAFRALRAWFIWTPEERRFLAAVAAIFLLGLIARYYRMRQLENRPVSEPQETERGVEE